MFEGIHLICFYVAVLCDLVAFYLTCFMRCVLAAFYLTYFMQYVLGVVHLMNLFSCTPKVKLMLQLMLLVPIVEGPQMSVRT